MSYRYGTNDQGGQPLPSERRIMIAMLVTFVLVSLLVMWAGRFPNRPGITPLDGPTYKTYVTAADELLSSYGRTTEGTIHIPIDRAIELVAERGLPTREVTAKAP